jgi:hypothetical protein
MTSCLIARRSRVARRARDASPNSNPNPSGAASIDARRVVETLDDHRPARCGATGVCD